MTTPSITKGQIKIIHSLYKFRFLTINHLQKLLNHKAQYRINTWLQDLQDKKYISVIKDKDRTQPFIYCLDTKSGHVLKDNEKFEKTFLSRLYKEKSKERPFINHHLFIATVYLFFLSKKEKQSVLKFFTKQNLKGYQYFPDPLPDAYISVKNEKQTKRYFLDLFDPNIPPFVLRNRIKYYLKYFQDGQWQENTENSPFPLILFVCPNDRLKKHIFMYSKSLLQKSFNNEVKLFLTTKEILEANNPDLTVWEQAK